MALSILSLGTAVPTTSVSAPEALAVARALCGSHERAAWLPAIYEGAGITTRHFSFERELVEDVLAGSTTSGSVFLPTGDPADHGPSTAERMAHYARHAAPLALRAAGLALERSGQPAAAITHLVTVSCTGFGAPGVDVALIRDLALAPTTQRTHLGFMGCHAALNGLRVARAFVEADPAACVLLCAVELCSLHYHYGWDPQKVVANSLFADGAAALVCVNAAAGPIRAWQATASGSCLIPDSEDAMTWSIGDHGFAMTLSKQVPALIGRHLRPWLVRWLEEQGLGLGDVGSWAVHPGGPRILTAVEAALGLDPLATDASRQTLAENGNMSSPTLLFILERLARDEAPRPCVALGFGPGLHVEAALLR